MPLYDYVCRSCDAEFELLVRPGDEPTCPSCRSRDLERLLSTFTMTTLDQTKAFVRAERKRRAPIVAGHQREELEHEIREHYPVDPDPPPPKKTKD